MRGWVECSGSAHQQVVVSALYTTHDRQSLGAVPCLVVITMTPFTPRGP
jgi:hypothetical protein